MRYSDFEDHIHTLVLERGKAYYEKGFVHDLEQSESGWTASVKGSSDYNIKLEGTDIISQWYCDCPNEHGPVCKHLVATMFAIRDAMKKHFRDQIEGMSESELADLVTEIAFRVPEARRFVGS